MQSNYIAKFLTIVFALALSQSAFAQSTGSLSGTISDPNGAIVQGANVTVKNISTNLTRDAVSNEEGRWTVSLLPVGTYSVTYEKEGLSNPSAKTSRSRLRLRARSNLFLKSAPRMSSLP